MVAIPVIFRIYRSIDVIGDMLFADPKRGFFYGYVRFNFLFFFFLSLIFIFIFVFIFTLLMV